MFDPGVPSVPVCFSEQVFAGKVVGWLSWGTKHPVFQAELLPVAVAAATWCETLIDRDVLVFLDNEAARYALVKGYSPVASAAKLLGEAWLSFSRSGASVWIARVPSGSNPADAPSRLQECPGWRKVRAKVPKGLGDVREWFVAG